MEITAEKAEEYGLSNEAIEFVKGLHESTLGEVLPEKELHYDNLYKDKYSTAANDNAEKIIGGAAESLVKGFGLDLKRESGEKAKDYYERINDAFKNNLNTLKEAELKESNPKFIELQGKYDEALQKASLVDEYEPFKAKYEELLDGNNKLKQESAFSSSMPAFSKEANEFEVKAKSKLVKDDVLAKFDIEEVDGVWMAVDKENPYKKKELKSVIEGYDEIKSISKERTQRGTRTSIDGVKVEGVPFDIPKEAKMIEVYDLINKHLESKGLKPYQDEFTKKFKEYSDAIKKSKAA